MTPRSAPALVDTQVHDLPGKGMQIPDNKSVEVKSVADTVRGATMYTRWTSRGVTSHRYSDEVRKERGVDSVSPEMNEMVDFIMGIVEDAGVMPDDVIFVELADGILIDIPRMKRQVVSRGDMCYVATPSKIQSGSRYDDQVYWKTSLGEALLFDVGDDYDPWVNTAMSPNTIGARIDIVNRESVRKMLIDEFRTLNGFMREGRTRMKSPDMAMLFKLMAKWHGIEGDLVKDCEVFERLAAAIFAYQLEQAKKSPSEIQREAKWEEERLAEIVGEIKAEYGNAVKFMNAFEKPNNRQRVIRGIGIDDLATWFGRKNVTLDQYQFLHLVGDIFGKEDPNVVRAWTRMYHK